MKQILLTQNKVVLVDDEDYEKLSEFKWYAVARRGWFYAVRNIRLSNGKRKQEGMHRQILNTPDNMHTDHINGDGLDNRRNNLRICTRTQNAYNQKKKRGVSLYKGVYPHSEKWYAGIRINGIHIYLGSFKNETDAAQAYDEAALKYFGCFARLNFGFYPDFGYPCFIE